MIGHSFGGTIVFEAIANIYKARLAEDWPGRDSDGKSGTSDLVLGTLE